MKCAWKELISILPQWMRFDVDRLGVYDGQELRLRQGQSPYLICKQADHVLRGLVTADDLQFVLNTASQYSPWAAQTISQGFVTAPGGHRIGVCGDAVMQEGKMTGIRTVTSLCIRIARDFPGVALPLMQCKGSILIIGPPGSGKTTMLRDVIRQRSSQGAVCVSDERGELFPMGILRGNNVDVLYGPHKGDAIEILIRSMCPMAIAVDEITAAQDAEAIKMALWCGVDILATAHAWDISDLNRREIYKSLMDSGVFAHVVVLQRNKSCRIERVVA